MKLRVHFRRLTSAAEDDREVVEWMHRIAAALCDTMQQASGVLCVTAGSSGKAAKQQSLMIVRITSQQRGAVGCDMGETIGFQIADCVGQNGDSSRCGVAGRYHLDC